MPDELTQSETRPLLTRRFAGLAVTLLGALILLAGATYLLRIQILQGVGAYLVVKDAFAEADALYILNGDPTTRPFEAVKLLKAGKAARVLISRAESILLNKTGILPNTTDLCLNVLRAGGIPESDIIELHMPGGVTSTVDEARLLKQYTERNGLHSAIIVTSSFHTRRARWIFRRVFAGSGVRLFMWPTENPKYNEFNWWTMEDGVIGLQNEYIKLVYYYLRY